MQKLSIKIENSLLKPMIIPRFKIYLKGWEESLKNFNDFSKEEVNLKRA